MASFITQAILSDTGKQIIAYLTIMFELIKTLADKLNKSLAHDYTIFFIIIYYQRVIFRI